MSDLLAIHCLYSNISAIVLQPVIFNRSKIFTTLAAEVLLRELDIRPSVCRKGYNARLSWLFEGSDWQHAHLIYFWRIMFVSLDLQVPIIVISEVPIDGGVVIEHLDSDGVPRVASPGRRSLRISQSYE